jgi:hypothetical protein
MPSTVTAPWTTASLAGERIPLPVLRVACAAFVEMVNKARAKRIGVNTRNDCQTNFIETLTLQNNHNTLLIRVYQVHVRPLEVSRTHSKVVMTIGDLSILEIQLENGLS